MFEHHNLMRYGYISLLIPPHALSKTASHKQAHVIKNTLENSNLYWEMLGLQG